MWGFSSAGTLVGVLVDAFISVDDVSSVASELIGATHMSTKIMWVTVLVGILIKYL